jgi:hypothetical protein
MGLQFEVCRGAAPSHAAPMRHLESVVHVWLDAPREVARLLGVVHQHVVELSYHMLMYYAM